LPFLCVHCPFPPLMGNLGNFPCISRAKYTPPDYPGLPDDSWLCSDSHESWLGTTVPQRSSTTEGVCWSPSDGTSFQVRCGPNYVEKKLKQESAASLYDCVSLDVVRSDRIVNRVLGRLVPAPQSHTEAWSAGCGLPHTICFVINLPYTTNFAGEKPDDTGCSIVTVHTVTDETLRLNGENSSAAVRLFKEFCAKSDGPCVDRATSSTSGVLKGIATGENVDELGLPWVSQPMVRNYNGTPALMTRSAHVHKGPDGNWMEVDIDVRFWSYAARSALYNLRSYLARAVVHIGFCVQGCGDDELPEGVLCAVRLWNLDIVKNPLEIFDEPFPARV